ncbi:MAG: hypothetical protein R2712_09765 [Vicinamibacterales bacterium]
MATVSNVRAFDATAFARLTHLDRRHAVVLVHDGHGEVAHVAAEGVAQHDELDQREDERHDDEKRASAEAPQLALDDGQVPCIVGS